MSFDRFLTGSARYRRFLGDGAEGEYTAEYDEYSLDRIGISETEGWDGEGRDNGQCALYFFPAVSTCRDELGEDTALPRSRRGDVCVIDGRQMRVTGAEYCRGGSESICHIKIMLI